MERDLASWLDSIGLGSYARAFAENDIDESVLADLTDADLRELGLSLGHRKRLLRAIAEREAGPARPAAAGPELAAWERFPGERKPVTLLFADLTRSTALTERLDSEDTHELLYGATRRMCEAVEANAGTVCRFMGDGVMAMFGAPAASEHHAVDACRAALALQAAIREYSAGLERERGVGLEARVGLHSGEVVVLSVGSGDRVEHDASGPAVPVAARMEQAAAPGTILVTAATRGLARDRFEFETLPPLRVKGISEPVAVCALRAERAESETPAPAAPRLLVGREAELVELEGTLESCRRTGRGRAVYVRGDAGIGKTRLVEELIARAAAAGFACHKALVLDFGVGKGRDAVRALVRSLLGLAPGSPKAERARAARRALDEGVLDGGAAPYLNDLLDLEQPPELRALYDAMDHRGRDAGKRAVLVGLAGSASASGPLLVAVEDLHWADRPTLAHVGALARASAETPLVLVLTSRLDGDPLAGAEGRGLLGTVPRSTIDLGPLREQDAARLVELYAEVPEPTARRCLQRAVGNPLFLEQLLSSAREGALEGLPESIQSLVLARADRLPAPDKRALQAASVVGQRFDLELLRHLLGDPAYVPDVLLAHALVREEEDGYLFSHALVREGVYASLLRRERSRLHLAAADWLAERDPVLRARHLDRAGDPRAPEAHHEAARRQALAYRFDTALDLAVRGLALGAAGTTRHRLRCLAGDLALDLGRPEEALASFGEALAEAGGDEVARAEALVGIAAALRVTTDYEGALARLREAEPIVAGHGLTELHSRIEHLRGNLCFPLGRIDECREAHARALDLAREAGSAELEARARGGLGDAEYARGRMRSALAHFEACSALCHAAGLGRVEIAYRPMEPFSLMYLARLDEAMDKARAAVEAARRVRHDRAEMNALAAVCHVAMSTGDLDVAEDHAGRGLAVARELGARTWLGVFELWAGTARLGAGDRAGALAALGRARDGMTGGEAFNGGRICGALALAQAGPGGDRAARDEALARGERLLAAGSVSHNHLWFHRFAIEARLADGEWSAAQRHAAALEAYTRAEPLPWAEFFAARGRALAAFGRGSRDEPTREALRTVREAGAAAGFRGSLTALDEALAAP